MNWQIQQIIRERRNSETGAIPTGRGASISVCLIYPNQYETAMSSLGFQTVYRLFNAQPGLTCERAFLPGREELALYEKSGETLVSLESERPVSEFDIIAFSISFEPDFINIPTILRLARIPVHASERDDTNPMVIGGGAALFINPEPAAFIFDLIAIGEGEPLVPGISALISENRQAPRQQIISAAAEIPGLYTPHVPQQKAVKRVYADLDTPPASSVLLTENTEDGNMFLVEVGRGCPRGCRFCAAGFVWQPFRQNRTSMLKDACLEGLKQRKTIGLVGAAVSDHRHIEEICTFIYEHSGSPSLSSLRLDRLTPSLLDLLVKSGHRTVSLAPEGGSQRMRDLVRKNLTASQIVDAAEAVSRAGILNLRLYFIIGLPGESDQDLEEMTSLVADIRERFIEQAKLHKRLGEITLSINPFIPKPFTPLQWEGICSITELKRKVNFLEKRLRPFSNVRLKVEELQGAMLQAILSKGGRELEPLLLKMSEGLNLRKAAKACGIDVEAIATARLPLDATLPWDVIETEDRTRLVNEYKTALQIAGVEP